MTSKSVVRIAGPDDYAECWRLMLASHRENGLFPMNGEKVDWFLRRFLFPDLIPPEDMGIRGVIGVIGEVGELEGMCGLVVADIWYTTEKHLADFLVYVDPEHRASEHGNAMIKWMKKQSDLIGIPLLSGVVSNKRTEAKCRMFRRAMPKIGEYFLYSNRTTH